MFSKVVVAYEGSDPSKRALNMAIAMAQKYSGELDLVSVQEPLPHYMTKKQTAQAPARSEEYFRQIQLEAVMVAGEANVILHPHVIQGHEVEAILEFVKKGGHDLLVIGQVGHTHILQRVWGGTAQNLTRLAPCSVMVVK